MWAVLLLALVAAVSAQLPSPCPGPESFTGRFRRMDREKKFFVEGRMYYDSVNQRVREFEFEEIGSDKEAYDKLRLYSLGIEYTVDLKTRKCNVTATHRNFMPFGVPPDARFRGEGTLGAVGVANEEVTIAFFEGEFEGRGWDAQHRKSNKTGQTFKFLFDAPLCADPYFVSVTQPDCFVVEFGSYSNTSGFYHREFYDVVSGISDPMAFVPPSNCV